jgi:hypothetical protein
MLISEALEGKFVKSSQGQGLIQYADRRTDIFIRDKSILSYAVKVRPHWNGEGFPKPDFWTTIYVGIDGEDKY